MPASVDRAIDALCAKGHSKASAIRILKSRGTIRQKGAHLAAGKMSRGMKTHREMG